jgi:alanine dehydrogenase
MPGGVPATATQALSNVVFPYVLEIANKGLVPALASDRALGRGLNVRDGAIVHDAIKSVVMVS